jgi:hypothetical protein
VSEGAGGSAGNIIILYATSDTSFVIQALEISNEGVLSVARKF